MGTVLYFIILIAAFTYKLWWRPKVCKEKIADKVKEMGGQVMCIEALSLREELYCVMYIMNEKNEKGIVKFNFRYEQQWK